MNLEDMTNTVEILREAYSQNESINLLEFYSVQGSGRAFRDAGLCGFITRKQSFYCYAFNDHGLVFENVCGSIFVGDRPQEMNEYYTTNHYLFRGGSDKTLGNWRYANENFGVISIQLLLNKGVFVWVPDKINGFQKDELLKFCLQMKDINQQREEKGIGEVEVRFSIFDGNDFSGDFNIEEFVSQIDSLVDENAKTFSENMVADYAPQKNIKRV